VVRGGPRRERFVNNPRNYGKMTMENYELMRLAPRLRPYVRSPRPAWPEIVDAADRLRGELGVSKSLWGEACIAMGREQAAIAIGILSAKPAAHFRSTCPFP
jgi:replication initiation protein RepC